MNKKAQCGLTLLAMLCIFIGVLVLLFTLTDPVTKRLDESCNEYGMSYEYRDGKNCFDRGGVLHPIVSDCSILVWNECEIRFIKGGK